MSTKRLTIFDTTLRDGEQAPGFSLRTDEKLTMARQLAALGVDVIEAGFPSPRRLTPNRSGSWPRTSAGRWSPVWPVYAADIDRAGWALDPAPRRASTSSSPRRICTSNASSGCRARPAWTPPSPRSIARAAIPTTSSFRRKMRREATWTFCAASSKRSSRPDARQSICRTPSGSRRRKKSASSSVRSCRVCRTPATPRSAPTATTTSGLRWRTPWLPSPPARRQVECTINGVGERAGNASLEEIVMATRVRSDLLPFETRIETREIYPSSQLLTALTGESVQSNKAIVGRNAFAHEAGIHQDGMLKDRRTYEIMRPEEVGVPQATLVLGKHSGRHAVQRRCEQLGTSVDRHELDRSTRPSSSSPIAKKSSATMTSRPSSSASARARRTRSLCTRRPISPTRQPKPDTGTGCRHSGVGIRDP